MEQVIQQSKLTLLDRPLEAKVNGVKQMVMFL